MRYLSAEELLVLHALIIDETGGSHGVREPGLLRSIAHKPQARFGGKELYRGVFAKAAVLLEAAANYHVFIDGNKRTSFAAAVRFLFLNGYDITATNATVESMVLAVATKRMDIQELAAWLKAHAARHVIQRLSEKEAVESVRRAEEDVRAGRVYYGDPNTIAKKLKRR